MASIPANLQLPAPEFLVVRFETRFPPTPNGAGDPRPGNPCSNLYSTYSPATCRRSTCPTTSLPPSFSNGASIHYQRFSNGTTENAMPTSHTAELFYDRDAPSIVGNPSHSVRYRLNLEPQLLYHIACCCRPIPIRGKYLTSLYRPNHFGLYNRDGGAHYDLRTVSAKL